MEAGRWSKSKINCGGNGMKLIDADRLKEVLDRNFSHTGGAEVMSQIIDKQPTAYDDDDIKRAILLLSKVVELLDKQNKTIYVLNLLEETVSYDGVECDGSCLKDDIECLLSVLRGEHE